MAEMISWYDLSLHATVMLMTKHISIDLLISSVFYFYWQHRGTTREITDEQYANEVRSKDVVCITTLTISGLILIDIDRYHKKEVWKMLLQHR